jgi:hypothetical protein
MRQLEQHEQHNHQQKYIFGLEGSATEEQALAMLKAKGDERLATRFDIVAMKDQANVRQESKRHHRPRHHRLQNSEETRATRSFRAAPPKD